MTPGCATHVNSSGVCWMGVTVYNGCPPIGRPAGMSFAASRDVAVLSNLVDALRDYRQRLLNVHVMMSLRRSLFERLLHLPLPKLGHEDGRHPVPFDGRCGNDADQLQSFSPANGFQLHRTGSGGGGEGSIMERKSVRKGRQPVPPYVS